MRNGNSSEQKRRRIAPPEEQNQVIPERMMSRVGRTEHYVLIVKIKMAKNAEYALSSNGMFSCSNGLYQVCVTQSQNLKEFRTDIVRGDEVYPHWDQMIRIAFEKRPVKEHLFLEVLQFGKLGDPTTSSGAVVAGRAMIPVPSEIGVLEKRCDRLISVTPSGKTTIGGVILLNVKLQAKKLWD